MRNVLRKAWVVAHLLSGLALVASAVLLFLLSGWGFSDTDVPGWFNLGPVPYLAFVALPAFALAWRVQGRLRRLAAGLAAASFVAAAVSVASMVLDANVRGYGGMPPWAVPAAILWVSLARLALAYPLLVAWDRGPGAIAAAGVLAVTGTVLGSAPRHTMLPLADVVPWSHIALLTLVGLGVAYAILGVAWGRGAIDLGETFRSGR